MSLQQGQFILFKLCCPGCGEPLTHSQPQVSDFFYIHCLNKECHCYLAEILVERRTGQILSTFYPFITDGHGKRWRVKYEEVFEGE